MHPTPRLAWRFPAAARALAAVAALALTACATSLRVEPIVGHSAAPDPQAGYIAGDFRRTLARENALVIRSADGAGRTYTMSMGTWSGGPSSSNTDTVAIRVAPGSYAVSQWIAQGVSAGKDLEDGLALTFDVRAGEVVHLGRWDIYEVWEPNGRILHMKVLRWGTTAVRESFALAYKPLADLPFHCVTCRGF